MSERPYQWASRMPAPSAQLVCIAGSDIYISKIHKVFIELKTFLCKEIATGN